MYTKKGVDRILFNLWIFKSIHTLNHVSFQLSIYSSTCINPASQEQSSCILFKTKAFSVSVNFNMYLWQKHAQYGWISTCIITKHVQYGKFQHIYDKDMFSMGKFQHVFVYDKNMFIVGKFQTYMSNALSKGGLQSINCKPRSAVLFSPADFVKLLHLVYFLHVKWSIHFPIHMFVGQNGSIILGWLAWCNTSVRCIESLVAGVPH